MTFSLVLIERFNTYFINILSGSAYFSLLDQAFIDITY